MTVILRSIQTMRFQSIEPQEVYSALPGSKMTFTPTKKQINLEFELNRAFFFFYWECLKTSSYKGKS